MGPAARLPGALTIPNGSTFNIVGGATQEMPGGILTNNGTIVHTGGGQIRGGLGTAIYNNGLWLEETDSYFYNDDGGVATIQNAGTFRKTAGTGITYVGDGTAFLGLNNSGLVDAQGGEIQIGDGGTNTGAFQCG